MTVLENIAQSRIQHLEPSGQKVIKSAKNGAYWPIAGGQTILPDRSLLIGQKLVENVKIHKCDILSKFQTWCLLLIS